MSIRTRGFTLIELLVVIAIIGILSSVVLVSLNVARSKGADAAVKSDLHTIETQATLFQDTHTSRYNTDGVSGVTAGTACPSTGNTMFANDQTIAAALVHAQTNGGAPLCYMATDGSAYAVQVPLKTSGYWCVDSLGIATTSASAMTSSWTKCQ